MSEKSHKCRRNCIYCKCREECETLLRVGPMMVMLSGVEHVLSCPLCCQNEIMRSVLEERSNSKINRIVVNAALVFEEGDKPSDPCLVDEFVIRHGYWSTLKNRPNLTDKQIYRGLTYVWERWEETFDSRTLIHSNSNCRVMTLVVRLSQIFQHVDKVGKPPVDGFMDWLNTAEVMLS